MPAPTVCAGHIPDGVGGSADGLPSCGATFPRVTSVVSWSAESRGCEWHVCFANPLGQVAPRETGEPSGCSSARLCWARAVAGHPLLTVSAASAASRWSRAASAGRRPRATGRTGGSVHRSDDRRESGDRSRCDECLGVGCFALAGPSWVAGPRHRGR